MHPQLALLKVRRFLPLFITQFLGAFNDNIFKNALIILITFQAAHLSSWSPQVLVTLAAGIFILPFFLFSATAGQLADKFEKSQLIRYIKTLEIILMGVATYGLMTENLILLMSVLFGLGVHSAFFGPIKYAILPDHLSSSELIGGNGLVEAGTFIAILLGTIFGGVLIVTALGGYLISSTILLVACFGLIASFYIPKTERNSPDIKIKLNFLRETATLVTYAKQRRDLFNIILAISWFWLFGATYLAQFPVFAKNILHANAHVVTFFLTLFTVGLGLGSLTCNKLLKGKVSGAYTPLAALGLSIFTIDLYFAAKSFQVDLPADLITLIEFFKFWQGWRISADLLLIAICGGIYSVPLYALLQFKSDKTHRARMIAANNVINAFFMVLSTIFIIILLKINLSVIEIFLILGLINILVVFYLRKLDL